MRKIKGIFIESDSSILSKYKTSFDESFDITIFKDSNSSLSYIIENNLNIYFYVVRISNENEDSVKFFADKIKEINPQIKLVIIESENGALDEKKYNDALIFTKQIDAEHIVSSIKKYIENIDDNQKRRQYSRVNWPLHVIIGYKDKIKNSIDRNILSISGNGAYISSDTSIPDKGDMLGLTISFKDFKLFTEAKVVWVNDDNKKPEFPKGFAVQFIDIGPASQKIIDQIIRDKLLQEILIEYKDENFSW